MEGRWNRMFTGEERRCKEERFIHEQKVEVRKEGQLAENYKTIPQWGTFVLTQGLSSQRTFRYYIGIASMDQRT